MEDFATVAEVNEEDRIKKPDRRFGRAFAVLGLATLQAAIVLLERPSVVIGCATFRTMKGCKFGL
jgi:hypothetical protein